MSTAKKAKRPRYLDVGDPCVKCGRPLRTAGVSGAYLECSQGHVDGRRVRCEAKGCRRMATSFTRNFNSGVRGAHCAEHDTWPF